jgi:rod shape determining protein RodA
VSRDFLRQMPGSHQYLSRGSSFFYRLHIDPILFFLLILLCGIGLGILYSASGQSLEHVERQLTRLAIAFVVMFVFAQLDPIVYKRWSPWLFILGLSALVGVLFFGVGAKGAQRWLQLPGLPRFQPSEFMKLVVPMMLAWYLSSRYLPPSFKVVVVSLLIIFVPVVLVLKQPDLGTSLLIASAGIFVLMFAGLSWRMVGGFAAVVAAFAPILWMFIMYDYQRQRVLTFLNPESDPLGSGWNIIQSKTAIGSGGLWGKGWLNGTQSQLDFLPESHTDFIIAVCAEEFGFMGVLGLILVYLLIVFRGLFIALKAQDSYSRILSGSLVLTFFIYIFVNIGMVSGILPVVGLPLPLVSYGGTSAVTLMAAFGVLMSVHTHRKMLTR